MHLPSEIEVERRNRIRLLLASYAYEFKSETFLTDQEFDKLALKIQPEIETGHEVCDEFFKNKFHPSTGQWIHDFPELDKLANLYKNLTLTNY